MLSAAVYLKLVAPISFQAETITLAGTLGRDLRERLSIIFFEGAFLTVVGLLGLFTIVVNFIGPVISNAMMAGVGIILAKVAVDMVKKNYSIGLISVVTALLTYYITPNPGNKLVYTIVISVIVSTIAALLLKQENDLVIDESREKFIFQKPIMNANVLQLLCLDGHDARNINGKRVAIIDDVISTGESINAIERLIKKAGGIVVAKAAILAEGDDAADMEDIIYLQLFPIKNE